MFTKKGMNQILLNAFNHRSQVTLYSRFWLDYESASYNKSAVEASRTATVKVCRDKRSLAGSVILQVTGGKESCENYGIGTNFTGEDSGLDTWVNSEYETSWRLVRFAVGETEQEINLVIENNPVLELDRVMTLSLINPSAGVVSGGSRTVTIIDDNIPETEYPAASGEFYRNIIDVTRPNEDYDDPEVNARTGLDEAENDGSVTVHTKIQAMINWLHTNDGGVLYFPNGTYLVNKDNINPYWNQTYVGESKAGVIFKRQDAQNVGNLVNITSDDPAVVTLPSGHGLANNIQVFFTTLTGDWEALKWDPETETGYSWKIANLSGDTCNLVRADAGAPTGNVSTAGFDAYVPSSDPVYVQYKYHMVFYTGTDYSHVSDDSPPMAFVNLTFNGNSPNQGPWKVFELEQSPCISLNGDTASVGLLTAKCENLHFHDNVSGAIKPNGNLDLNAYEITKENGNIWNIFACACPATNTLKVVGKNITGTATRAGEAPGFSTENIKGKICIDLYDFNTEGNISLNALYPEIEADSYINITGGSIEGALLMHNNHSAAANIPMTIQGTAADLFLLNCTSGDIRASNGGSILFDYVDFGGDANVKFSKYTGTTGNDGTVEFKRSILRTAATKYKTPYSPETVNGYYAAAPVTSATAGETGHVYKLTDCTFVNELGVDISIAVPHILTSALGVFKTVIDGCDIPATFTHGIRRYVFANGAGQGGEYELIDGTINCGIAVALTGGGSYLLKVTQDNIDIGSGCEFNYDFMVPNANQLAGYLDNTDVTVHPDCKVRLNNLYRPLYHFYTGGASTISGHRTITEGNAPTTQYPHGILGDQYTYDGTGYSCTAWVYLQVATQRDGTWA